MQHQFAWHSPAPLWAAQLALTDEPRTRFLRPEILRFETDAFMEELIAALKDDPSSLGALQLRSEQWDSPPNTDEPPPDVDEKVKLFQPTHGRYYVAVASLVCQTRGLPDRAVDLPAGETVSFVLRRRQADKEFRLVRPRSGLEGSRRRPACSTTRNA